MFEEFRRLATTTRNPLEEYNPYSQMTESTKRELFHRYKKMFIDPIEFYRAVNTLDESHTTKPIRKFPIHLEYIRFFIQIIHRSLKIAVPKSRRMKISWTCLIYLTWDAMFHQGRAWAAVSKKEDDSNELVKRCIFIVNHLDKELFPKELIPGMNHVYCRLEFPELLSTIKGYPSGADQLRQFTFSGMFADEFAFWPSAEEMYSGAKPTLEGTDGSPGGKAILVSSRAPGFFKRVVYDRIDDRKDFLYEVAQSELTVKTPLTGIELWKNKKNKFTVVDIHYTADPAKRSEAWKENEKSGIPLSKWNREYEKSWDSYEGLPIYAGTWSQVLHGGRNLKPQQGLPLLRSWDFGLTPSCIVGQMQGTQLVIFREFQEFNMGTERFSELILPQINLLYPGFKWIDFIDPAGMNRDQSDEGQSALILDGKGLQCICGEVTFTKRLKAVEHYLGSYSVNDMEPNFMIDIANCPILVRGFNGGYRYPDRVMDREPNKLRPLKDEHSHTHDALQYMASGVFQNKMPGSRVKKRQQISYNSDKSKNTKLSRSYY